jgi:hypothetical protein
MNEHDLRKIPFKKISPRRYVPVEIMEGRFFVTKIVFEYPFNLWKLGDMKMRLSIYQDFGCDCLLDLVFMDFLFAKIFSFPSNMLSIDGWITIKDFWIDIGNDLPGGFVSAPNQRPLYLLVNTTGQQPYTLRMCIDWLHVSCSSLCKYIGPIGHRRWDNHFPEIIIIGSERMIWDLQIRTKADGRLIPQYLIVIDARLHLYAISLNPLIRSKEDIRNRIYFRKYYLAKCVQRLLPQCSDLDIHFQYSSDVFMSIIQFTRK